MGKKYLVKPGYVKSRSDGDEHYISFHQLCDLYKVSTADCLNLEMANMHGYNPDLFKDLPVLTPRSDGNYQLTDLKPSDQEAKVRPSKSPSQGDTT